jgi:hypothetical protein
MRGVAAHVCVADRAGQLPVRAVRKITLRVGDDLRYQRGFGTGSRVFLNRRVAHLACRRHCVFPVQTRTGEQEQREYAGHMRPPDHCPFSQRIDGRMFSNVTAPFGRIP